MTDHPIETRVEVTDHQGRRFVSRDPMDVLLCRYAPQDGYRLREVRGYEVPDGFRIVDRSPGANKLPRTPSEAAGEVNT